MPRFKRFVKKLPRQFQQVILDAVEEVLANPKGSRENNFAELALRFGPDLADPREQNHRNSELFRGQFYKIGCE